MNKEILEITNEDIELLKEMRKNCLKSNVYEDDKRLLKSNAITKFLMLYEENAELKKQVEEALKNYEKEAYIVDKQTRQLTDEYKNTKYQSDKVNSLLTQQKEFIKYLEDETKQEENKNTIELLSDPNSCRTPNLRYKENILKEILQKYKSIIGVLDEKENKWLKDIINSILHI